MVGLRFKGPLNLELNGLWVWACAHFDGGFLLGMEKGTVFHLKTNGEVESTNWSSVVSVEGWLGESGELSTHFPWRVTAGSEGLC